MGVTKSSSAARRLNVRSRHKLQLNQEHVASDRNHTLDDLGIAKTHREEQNPRPRRQDQAGRRKRPHGQALSRTRLAKSPSRASSASAPSLRQTAVKKEERELVAGD